MGPVIFSPGISLYCKYGWRAQSALRYSMEMSSSIFNEWISFKVSSLLHRNNFFIIYYFAQVILNTLTSPAFRAEVSSYSLSCSCPVNCWHATSSLISGTVTQTLWLQSCHYWHFLNSKALNISAFKMWWVLGNYGHCTSKLFFVQSVRHPK